MKYEISMKYDNIHVRISERYLLSGDIKNKLFNYINLNY